MEKLYIMVKGKRYQVKALNVTVLPFDTISSVTYDDDGNDEHIRVDHANGFYVHKEGEGFVRASSKEIMDFISDENKHVQERFIF